MKISTKEVNQLNRRIKAGFCYATSTGVAWQSLDGKSRMAADCKEKLVEYLTKHDLFKS